MALESGSPSLLSFLPASILPNSAIAVTLFRLAHSAFYEASACIFGLDSSAAACFAFIMFVKLSILANLVDFESDLKQIKVDYGWISFPNYCGILEFSKFGIDTHCLLRISIFFYC